MKFPVLGSDGGYYERDVIHNYLKNYSRSPITHAEMKDENFPLQEDLQTQITGLLYFIIIYCPC
jgi:hypothetical protein